MYFPAPGAWHFPQHLPTTSNGVRAGTKQGFFAGLLLPALHYMTLHRVEMAPACSVALIILAAFSAQTWVVLLLLWEQNVCKTTKAITCFLVTVP